MNRPRPESLERAINHLETEARMILPGIQALFGFQLIAVYQNTFKTALNATEQYFHLASLGLIGIAACLVMAPAAYHRIVETNSISEDLMRVSTRFIVVALFPFALGISIDFYLISRIITGRSVLSALLSGWFALWVIGLWYVFPLWKRIQNERSYEPEPF